MTRFVGAEYVVANLLIEEKKKGNSFVSFDKLGKYGIYVQEKSLMKNIDVIFLTSRPQFWETIYDFSDYFECKKDESGNVIGISLISSKDIDDLQYRFIYYLPADISKFLEESVLDFVA